MDLSNSSKVPGSGAPAVELCDPPQLFIGSFRGASSAMNCCGGGGAGVVGGTGAAGAAEVVVIVTAIGGGLDAGAGKADHPVQLLRFVVRSRSETTAAAGVAAAPAAFVPAAFVPAPAE